MKFKFIFLFLILVPFINQAANETQVESNISEVNVYRQRAQITRKAKAKVQRGDNLIVFSGLSGSLLKNSITVSGNGDGIIQSVTHRVNYLNRTAKPPRMLLLEDSLEWITQEMQVLTDEKFVLTSEQNLILGNNKIGGTAEGLTTEELQKLANFYKSRLAEIMKGIRSILLKEKALKERQNAYTAEIQQIRARRDQPTQEVVVAFNAKSAGSIELTLKYLVNGAQWNPFYDIRVANTKDPIQFFLKANVVNNTGIDWNQVKLTVSTTNNTGNNVSPVLSPWYVNIGSPITMGRQREQAAGGFRPDSRSLSNTVDFDSYAKEDVGAGYAYEITQATEGELGLEFAISLPYDIPADGKEHQVDILLSEVKADFQHYSAPKLDRDAFLVANINHDLLRGNANVYFEGTFVGETYVNTDNPRDSMRISLGRDPKVQLQRAKVSDVTDRKVIGSNIRQTYKYEITIRNNKSEAVNLTVEDQIPVSQNKDITIELTEASGGVVDENSGKVTWDLQLKPGETRQLELSFEVKYPKNQPIQGL
ncbi:MAG: DUF4139 domain-containing protein [Bacteroidia bacterium]